MQVPRLPDFIYTIIQKLTLGKRVDEDVDVELNDLTYEDALLDAQARSFFRAEYMDKEASTDVFPRLAQAIRLHEQEQQAAWNGGPRQAWTTRATGVARRFATGFGQAMAGLYRAGSSAGTSRVLSGGLVTVLLVLTMAPNMLTMLSGPSGVNGTASFLPPQSPHQTLAIPLPDPQTRMEQKTGEDFDAPYQIQEVPPLDPVELRPVEKKASKLPAQPAHKIYNNGQE
ncbi:MAG TPA: hypothetical protein VJ183_00150 [Chloroflexia bacterium]|nr:hypothetical protein [Chloroflexia bacterium]